ALSEGNPFVETEKRRVPRHATCGRLVLYHDLEIADPLAELCRELVQRVANEARESRTPQVGYCSSQCGEVSPEGPHRLSGAGSRRACQSHPGERARSQTAHAGLGQADLTPDLPQSEPAPIRQDQDTALEGG